jgi:hypothetical protein
VTEEAEEAPLPSLTLEEVQDLVWRLVWKQEEDPDIVEITVTLPIGAAKILALIAEIENTSIEAVALQGLLEHTGYDAVLRRGEKTSE